MLIFSVVFFTLFFKSGLFETIYQCSPTAPCGCSPNSAILSRIVGGEAASSQTWGWAVSVRYSSSNSHFCGGSVISQSHILTAAHCVEKVSSVSAANIFVGSIALSQMNYQRSISRITMHPNYSSTTFLNDIAIIKLSSPLNLNATDIDRVCLPNVSSTFLASKEYPPVNSTVSSLI